MNIPTFQADHRILANGKLIYVVKVLVYNAFTHNPWNYAYINADEDYSPTSYVDLAKHFESADDAEEYVKKLVDNSTWLE